MAERSLKRRKSSKRYQPTKQAESTLLTFLEMEILLNKPEWQHSEECLGMHVLPAKYSLLLPKTVWQTDRQTQRRMERCKTEWFISVTAAMLRRQHKSCLKFSSLRQLKIGSHLELRSDLHQSTGLTNRSYCFPHSPNQGDHSLHEKIFDPLAHRKFY